MVDTTNLTPEEKLHVKLMSAIVRAVADTPMVLKGGTALLLAYHLDRYSEDLDFDSNKAMRLEKRIHEAAKQHVTVKSIDLIKDTGTVSRYRLLYESSYGVQRLKIETSLRDAPTTSQLIDGMKVYPLPVLIQQKLTALENRTRARDLYDLAFLAQHYPKSFTTEESTRLLRAVSNLDALEKRFIPAFENDSILYQQDVTQLIISLKDAVKSLEPRLIHQLEKTSALTEQSKNSLSNPISSDDSKLSSLPLEKILQDYLTKKSELSRLVNAKIIHLAHDPKTAQEYSARSIALKEEIDVFIKEAAENPHVINALSTTKNTHPMTITKPSNFNTIEKRMQKEGRLLEKDVFTLLSHLQHDIHAVTQIQHLTHKQQRGYKR